MLKLMYQAELTDEMIEEARTFEGRPLRIEQWNRDVTRDNIQHYAWGVGYVNPLYSDPEYGATTRFGENVPPVTFLYTFYTGAMGVGLIGIQPFGVGTRWEFLEQVRLGDTITVKAQIGPIEVHEGRTAKRFIIQTTVSEYVRQDGAVVARSWGRTARVPRGGADGGLSYKPRAPHQYTEDELEEIRRHVVNQPVRGGQTRYWDDVEAGEIVPAVLKGPLDQLTMTAYYAGVPGSPATKSIDIQQLYKTWALESPERLPNNYDPTFYAEQTPPSLGHQVAEVAHQLGMPGRYGNASQKSAWLIHPVLNWMGDDGDVVSMDFALRRPDVYGDTARCQASVVDKPELGIVNLRLWSENQLGDRTATGSARVRLPVRDTAPA